MRNHKRLSLALFLVILCAEIVWTWPAFSQGADAGILPPDGSYGGRSYQEWHALYVDQKLLPLYGYHPSNSVVSAADVYFLAAKSGNGSEISDVIPGGKIPMLMVVGILDSDEPVLDNSANEISLIDQDVKDWKLYAQRGSFSCAIDGVPVPNLQNYVFKNKLARTVAVPGNSAEEPSAKTVYNWGLGIDLLITGLAPGDHVIHIHNDIPEYREYTYDVTYKIFVNPTVPGEK